MSRDDADYRPLLATRYRFHDTWLVYCRACTGILTSHPWGPDATEQIFNPAEIGAPECALCARPLPAPKPEKEVRID